MRWTTSHSLSGQWGLENRNTPGCRVVSGARKNICDNIHNRCFTVKNNHHTHHRPTLPSHNAHVHGQHNTHPQPRTDPVIAWKHPSTCTMHLHYLPCLFLWLALASCRLFSDRCPCLWKKPQADCLLALLACLLLCLLSVAVPAEFPLLPWYPPAPGAPVVSFIAACVMPAVCYPQVRLPGCPRGACLGRSQLLPPAACLLLEEAAANETTRRDR